LMRPGSESPVSVEPEIQQAVDAEPQPAPGASSQGSARPNYVVPQIVLPGAGSGSLWMLSFLLGFAGLRHVAKLSSSTKV